MKNARLKRMIKSIVDFILLPVCPICNCPVDETNMVCAHCFKELHFITKPYCQKCGKPFEFDIKGDGVCAGCLKKNPPYRMARSVLVYNEGVKKLVLPFKHADRTDLTGVLCQFLLKEYKSLIMDADVIIPVPLHITRLFLRRYNQSALLAHRLAKVTHRRFEPSVLKRTRATPSQGHMNTKQRELNVHKAFAISNPKKIENKKVLLIDDVMTTGATVCECSKVLLKAGASHVDVLTLCRVKH
ncbi:MAG: ComF family protein [Alphaproteobacteria bacterium]|nr:ComF family protein [Alphaproteobacteria bacterium]